MLDDQTIKALLGGEISNGCHCDFCTRKKNWNDNWCPQCAEVKMSLPKWCKDGSKN